MCVLFACWIGDGVVRRCGGRSEYQVMLVVSKSDRATEGDVFLYMKR
jgi:hypothetical protein